MSLRLGLLVSCITLGCLGRISGANDSGLSDTDAGTNLGTLDGGCSRDLDCGSGLSCAQNGTCISLGCVSSACPSGQRCDLQSRLCVTAVQGPHRLYRASTLAGTAFNSAFGVRDAVGKSAFGEFHLLIASRNGRFLYVVDREVVMRVETATGWVETISGTGWPGEVDGPAAVAQYETNFYQNGGLGLTPDQRFFIFTSPWLIRRVDVETGEGATIPNPVSTNPRSIAVGRLTGNLYVLNSVTTSMGIVYPDGGSVLLPLEGNGARAGFIEVDESRGLVYGLDRNKQSGAFYRWSVDGGAVEWLNHLAKGTRDPAQYLSDGPVANMEMANPGGMSIDKEGFVYIGGGDGRTFRRYDPDRGIVESLCRAPSDAGDDLLEWCIGDNVKNRPLGTWPSNLAMDDSGNAYFGYSVWPRLISLRRLE